MRRVVAILILSITAIAADWPVFRGGPSQTAASKEPLPNPLMEVWTFKVGNAVESTAAIVGGVIYVGSMDGKLFALELASGKQKWQANVGSIKAPVGVHDGKVYVGNDDGLFQCLNAADGKEVWKFNSEAEVTSGIAFNRDAVLFGCGDEQLHCLFLAFFFGDIFGQPDNPHNTSEVNQKRRVHMRDYLIQSE